jgi:hypothetical protein
MKFSWKALLLAPLAVPVLYGVVLEALVPGAPGRSPLFAFLFLVAVGSMASYGATVFLLLPALFALSRFRPLTATLTGLVGLVLGAVAWLPITWMSYRSSGADSGPPEGTFARYLWRQGLGIDFWAFLLAGLVTALLYWFLVKPPRASASASS